MCQNELTDFEPGDRPFMLTRVCSRRVLALLSFFTATACQATPGAIARRPVSFINEVNPVLTRAGCNAGACHGAAAGKGGVKLSLRGYAPELDY